MDNTSLFQSLGGTPLGVAQTPNAPSPMNLNSPSLGQPTQPIQQPQMSAPLSNAEKFAQLGGVPVGQETGPGFVQNLAQGIAKPFLRAGTTALNTGAAIRDFIDSGGQPSQQATIDLNTPRDYGYFGKVQPFSTDPGQGFKDAAGATIEGGSWFLGTGEADSLAHATLLQKAAIGAKTGAVIGGTMGLGSGLQDPNANVGSVLGSTAAGTAGGAIGGAILTPILSKAVGIFTKPAEEVSAGLSEHAAPTGEAAIPATGGWKNRVTNFVRNQVQQDWRDALNLPNSVTKKEAQSGKDVVSLLTDAGMKPDDIVDGRLVTTNAQTEARQHALVADKLLGTLLDTEPKTIPASEFLQNALGELKSTGTSLDSAASQVKAQLTAFIQQDGGGMPGAVDGGMQLNLSSINDIKGKAWTNVVDFGDPAKSIKNDANTAIARAGKQLIEDNVSDINIKALNSHIGDWWHALEVLQARDGAKVLGRGLTRVVNRAAGAAVGGILTHGLGGTALGSIAADRLTAFMTDSLLPMDLKMALLRKLEGDPETNPLVKQAWNLINKRAGDMVTRLQLGPAGEVMDAPNMPPSAQGSQPNFATGGKSVIIAGPPTGGNPEPYSPKIKYRMVKPPGANMDLKKIPKIKLPK